MHGEADREVPISHGRLLASKSQNLFHPWWVPNGNHSNLNGRFRTTYFVRLTKFINSVRDINQRKSIWSLDKLYRAQPWHDKSDHIYFQREKQIEESWNKKSKDQKVGHEHEMASPNFSFMSNNTYNYKNSTESLLMTVGDQSTRKIGQESARSAYESDIGTNSICQFL